MPPLVSVIIPTYNRANRLGRAVKSVLNQTFNNFELLIIDDGSEDNTHDIVSDFSDSRIIYLKHETNKGPNAARNSGLGIAQGENIAFLDSDDEWLPTMLEKQLEALKLNKGLSVVYARAYVQKADGDFISGTKFSLNGEVYKEALTQGYLSYMITLMVKKACFDKIGPFDEQFSNCDDDDICLRLAKEYRFGLIPDELAIIHLDKSTQISSQAKSYAEGWWKLFNKHESEIIRVCGYGVMAQHIMKSGHLFMRAKQPNNARNSFSRAFSLLPSMKTLTYFIFSRLPFSVLIFRIIHKLKLNK